MQMAVGDLEWSLMSICSAHKQLQAAHARQRRLLDTLNEVHPFATVRATANNKVQPKGATTSCSQLAPKGALQL